MKYIERESASILNKMKVIDSWFWCRYTLNPYNGCEHACIYCDAHSERYHLHQDFDATIYVKKNGPQLLERQISHSRTMIPDVVAIGGTCDPYQQAEAQYQITRKILQILIKYKYPVCLSSKSALMTRDADLLESIGKETWCAAAFTITTFDKEMAKFLEPGASSPEERCQAIKNLKQNAPHIHVGLNFMPIIPLLEDNEENLDTVIRNVSEAGVDYILFAPGVTLRDKQANFFLTQLKEKYPGKFDEFLNRFGPSKMHDEKYYHLMTKKLIELCNHYKIPFSLPRWIPSDFRKTNYQIAEFLLNKSTLNKMFGKPFEQYFWVAQNIQNLEESILDVARRGQLSSIRSLNSVILSEIQPFLKDTRPSLDLFLKK